MHTKDEVGLLSLKELYIYRQIKSHRIVYSMAQQCHPAAIPKCELQKSSQGKLSVAKDRSLKLAIRTNLGIYCLGQDDHLGHR